MLSAKSRHANRMLFCRCLHSSSPDVTEQKHTHASKNAHYRLVRNLKRVVSEIPGLTPMFELPTYIITTLRNITFPCHTDSMKSCIGCEVRTSTGQFNMAVNSILPKRIKN